MHRSQKILHCEKMCFYYLEGDREEERQTAPTHCFTPPLPAVAGAGPHPSQELGTQCPFPKWVTGAQLLGSSLLPPRGLHAREAGTQSCNWDSDPGSHLHVGHRCFNL